MLGHGHRPRTRRRPSPARAVTGVRPISHAARLAIAAMLVGVVPARAEDPFAACGATTPFEVIDFGADAIAFERVAPAPRRVAWHDGQLRVDGALVRLGAEDTDRMALFARELRALVPKVKAIAQRAVDVATGVVRSETRKLLADAGDRAELDARISAHAAKLRARINAARDTRAWTNDAFEHEVAGWADDLAPLLGRAIANRAVGAALAGDLDAAQSLQASAGELAIGLQPRIARALEVLRPDIEALCPALSRLQEAQLGVRDGRGRALDLVDMPPVAPRR
jgi:hypothetical protein